VEGSRAVVPAWKTYQCPQEIKELLRSLDLPGSFASLQFTRAVMILSYSAYAESVFISAVLA